VPDVDDGEESEGGQARPFWSGLLSFGLVSIPVDLIPAHRSSGSTLRMLDADGTPLARRYYCPADEQEVDAAHLVHGHELANGKVVVVTDEELESLAPKKSREIDLRRFVDRDQIDPLYFERSYFLAPGKDSGKAYRLLSAVMEKSRRAGIATFVMRDREYLVAIFSDDGLLRAETLRFAAEVRSSAAIGLPKPVRVEPKLLQKLTRAVEGLEQKSWVSSEVVDAHAAIRELAEKKYQKKKDVIEVGQGSSEGGAQVIDLMEVLRKSLAESGLAPKRRGANETATPRRAPQRSGAAPRRKAAAKRSKRKVSARSKSGAAPAKRARSAARNG
jgi:DNA end-binding protein Ku